MHYAVVILVSTKESAKALAQAICDVGLFPLIEERQDLPRK